MMKIAILGTRGIPNHYGGFEQFAEYLSVGLVQRGHDVTVYDSHSHPYQDSDFNGVTIKHVYDPENRIGTAGQFVYDLLCILDTRKRHYDVILQLGYTSSSVFFGLHPKRSLVITNMDGLEWKRTKYSAKVQKFLQWAEALAVKKSDALVSDSIGIQNYLQQKYGQDSVYIPYGAHVIDDFDASVCDEFGVEQYGYDMLIARLEPENSIEVILDGVAKAETARRFLVIGKYETAYGEYLKARYSNVENIVFVGGVYDKDKLDALRCFSNLYFHGHTVGGTNPSLLEAMGSNALVCAHENEFNAAILGPDALYFQNSDDVAQTLYSVQKAEYDRYLENNRKKIRDLYAWDSIIDRYEALMLGMMHNQS
ncbi:MAG: DUF1972 domain-containing protein [Sulfuricurvum sp.]|nr:DUF1972 domain-containing protein [Sulfuricurvum sp.]